MKDYLIGTKYYKIGCTLPKNIGKTKFFTLFDIRIPKSFNHIHCIFVWMPVANDTGLIVNKLSQNITYYNFIISLFLFRMSLIFEKLHH